MEPTTILIALALAFGPQAPAKPVPPAGDDFFTGLGQTDARPIVKKDAAAWRRDIARAQLLFEVDGKSAEARYDLARTWMALMKSEAFTGRGEVALEALDLATRIPTKVGEPDFVTPMLEQSRQGALATELIALANDPRSVRLRLRANATPRGDSPDSNQIDTAVLDALRAKNTGVLQELGVAAAPTLEREVRADPDAFKPLDEDPLFYLIRCAPLRASVVCRDLLSQPGHGFLVAKRVMRAMANAKPAVLSGASTVWRFAEQAWSDRAPTLTDPTWREVVTLLLRIPVAAAEALPLANQLAVFDALDEPLRAALLDVGRSDDSSLTRALARSIAETGQRGSVDPLLAQLLDVTSPEVRATAASELARVPRSESLLAKIGDRDPRVRAAIASGLQPGLLNKVQYSFPNWSWRESTIERAFDDRDRPLLERLLADEDPDVRTAALSAASSAEIRLTPEIAERLSKDPDAEVRRKVVLLLPRAAAAAAPFLGRALADSDAGVRKAAELVLLERYGIFQRQQGIVTEPVSEPASPALRALAIAYLVPGPAVATSNALRWSLLRVLIVEPDDTRELVRAFLAVPPNQNIAAQAMWQSLLSSERGEPGSLRFLDTEAVRALLVRAHSEKPSIDQVIKRLDETERTPDVQAGLAAFVADPAMSRAWRLILWNFIALDAGAEDFLVTALTKPPFGQDAQDPIELNAIGNLRRQGEGEGDAVLSRVLVRVCDAGLPDLVIAVLANTVIQQRGGPQALSKPLLERLRQTPGSASQSVRKWAMHQEAEQGRWEPVRSGLGDSSTRDWALEALGRSRPPQGLEWLSAYLHDPAWARNSGVKAAGAIAGYLSEDAAEILMRGAELAPTPEVRKACLDGVTEIRAFLDQKASWLQRSTGAKQRDAAVAELAAMLDSKDAVQRAEAARGLATLQGVEHLPRLVRMLQDPDAKVRAAVQESLGRLNAPR